MLMGEGKLLIHFEGSGSKFKVITKKSNRPSDRPLVSKLKVITEKGTTLVTDPRLGPSWRFQCSSFVLCILYAVTLT